MAVKNTQQRNKVDVGVVSRLRLLREALGVHDLDICIDLQLQPDQLADLVKRHGIRRKPGPRLSALSKLWRELEWRIEHAADEDTQRQTIASLNAWLANNKHQTTRRTSR